MANHAPSSRALMTVNDFCSSVWRSQGRFSRWNRQHALKRPETSSKESVRGKLCSHVRSPVKLIMEFDGLNPFFSLVDRPISSNRDTNPSSIKWQIKVSIVSERATFLRMCEHPRYLRLNLEASPSHLLDYSCKMQYNEIIYYKI